MIEMPDNGLESRAINEKADASVVRSVYLPLLRGVTPRALEAFDPVTQTLVTGQRDATTVPTQALFLLNSSFVRRQSLTLGEKLLDERSLSARVRQAYRLTLGRDPTTVEISRVQKFVDDYATAYAKTPPLPLKAVAAEVVAKTPSAPIDPDNIDRTDYVAVENTVEAGNPAAAAWMSFVQALYGSAEFRFVR